ncbi:hypothetical protein [Burkholderia cenocepacia]|uniref:hypothetical protein n=1 Tax=Burkholderia cenocepacia TaxID=95486 RepID=UPI000761D974|nr:hypothetical protein [Burkholderia cenocepacia]KWU26413.1 hypothetical protein AS149_25840 [Burkholderia cenocepacia]
MLGEPIQQFIDAADENGRITISTSHRPHLRRSEFSTRRAFIRAHVTGHFYPIQGFVSRFARVKSSFPEAEVIVAPVPGTNEFDISVNFARMLLLPGVRPAAELKEYREMMMSLRPFYQAFEGRSPCVKIMNERDQNRRTYGVVAFLHGKDDSSSLTREAGIYQKQLDERIASSPALQAWLKAYALDLNRLGRYSWMVVSEDHLFDYDDHPSLLRIRREVDARRAAASSVSNSMI